MKKVFLSLFSIALIFSACQKSDDHAFNKSPDERINEALAAYQSQLADAEFGWKALLSADSGRGATYSFYFKFNNENRVVMVSDFDSVSSVTPQQSSYRLKALQQPSLIFDTYSYLHVLSDPDASENGGAYGAGLNADFEFFFSEASADTVRLTGRFNGNTLVLVRATQQEGNAYTGGQFVLFSNYLDRIQTYYKRFSFESQLYDIRYDGLTRTIDISWLSNRNTQRFSTSCYNVLNGLVLNQPFVNGNTTITDLSNAQWDSTSSTLSVNAGSTTGTISPTVFPLKIEAGAAQRWWQNAPWLTVYGFHVNGVDDAYNIMQVSNYYFLGFWSQYQNVGGGEVVDLAGFVLIDPADNNPYIYFGPAFRQPTFTSDGKIVFPNYGFLGGSNVPPAAVDAVQNTWNQFIQTDGYYFVQTGADSYDMVSAKDGKAWITWQK